MSGIQSGGVRAATQQVEDALLQEYDRPSHTTRTDARGPGVPTGATIIHHPLWKCSAGLHAGRRTEAAVLVRCWLRDIGSEWAAIWHCLIDRRSSSFSFWPLSLGSPTAALARGSFTSARLMDGASAQAQILEAMTMVARGQASGAPTFAV